MDEVAHDTIRHCSFDWWYSKVRPRAVRAVTIPLSPDFCTFLREGEFVTDETMFPELREAFESGLEELGGRVFVKLNFTAPSDAQWATSSGTLEINTFDDAVTVLKASTRVLIDLLKPFGEILDPPVAPVLVMKRYFSYFRAREFRIFVRNSEIRFISSRYCDVKCDLSEEEVNELITEFLTGVLEPIFPEQKMIYDTYVSPKKKVHLVDVAPWNETADAGMFEWNELKTLQGSEIRLSSGLRIRPPESNGVPVELLQGNLDEIIQALKEDRE
jgi:hypothetical protein